ncbi:FAD-dependent oxidoreductase [Tessaracoccus oleiagri]|uniref:FAD dependent oxidoreductase n=1 Tax=Tessaracoccus oleiagri TaxID=686624 RepID=A0A1G9LUP2_9ACTN|nr:FAD-dependent oxidoreductase [Tessaracoccus oleiagri]SDL65534.1 FAD dependent oxidoreductase [Tessaracoccus oleiagri]
MSGTYYAEAARQVPIIAHVDVLVVGGGPSGIAAAVAAARSGAKTFLVEESGGFGGMWTQGLVTTLAGYNSWLQPDRVRVVDGIGGEWLRRATAAGGATDHDGWVISSDPEVMKLVADELLEEAGVDFLLHVLATYPIVEGDVVKGCLIETREGREAILAAATVDATGNGDIIARSGQDWVKGQTLQPMTMPMYVGPVRTLPGIDPNAPAHVRVGPEPSDLDDQGLIDSQLSRYDVPIDRQAMRAARERGELPVFGGPWWGGMDKETVWVNAVRIVGDATDNRDLTRAEVQGRRDARSLFEYFRDNVPGFAAARLQQTSPTIGIRETRRLLGVTTLTGADVRGGARQEDSIAIGAWPIDVHPTGEAAGAHVMFVPAPFGIPYRALVPANTDGLLATGRCISADREALGSIRVGATCTATGQAAGVAAALSARHSLAPRAIDPHELRRSLREQGALVDVEDLQEPRAQSRAQ